MPWDAHSNEPLDRHLIQVAEMASGFARVFEASDWGEAAGLLHDLGKACEAFQRRLAGDPASVDHLSAGAIVAIRRFGLLGRLVAYAIAGHHGGLPDAGGLDAVLERRPEFDENAIPPLPALGRPPVDMSGLGGALFVRMVFSCLVDADYLATERHYRPERARTRGVPFDAERLLAGLMGHVARLPADAPAVDPMRRRVLERCLAVADSPPGTFSLSVPTGGGKTLASMAFALAHAKRNRQRRVVAVIPYTSIIEQNAAVYRTALGADAVLEHHSTFRHPDDRPGEQAEARVKLDLAEENWDAPVVVTTSVQFFESLFADRTSRCRKLHNLAGAVIVLDEVQLMPLAFLDPCLETLRLLVKDYGCTLVLCTATQPGLGDREWLEHALPDVTEIMDDPAALHTALRRVTYRWGGRMADAELAERMAATDQALVVVNTRAHARALFDLIRPLPGAVHLSALMTPAHRARVLDRIRDDLKYGRPCRVVSTQLVECGVDVDFPQVFRALAGLDSIIQAAGRCNRSGTAAIGTVTVFEPEHGTPDLWREHANLAREVLTERFPGDPACPQAVAWYFRELYRSQRLDREGILSLLKLDATLNLSFATAARAFRFIDDGHVDVTVAEDDDARALIARLETEGAHRELLRALQRHTVQLREKDVRALGAALRRVGDRVLVLAPEAYDPVTGVRHG